ncbi:MAG: sugar phosphate nucleotidyltransferase [Candidatus Aenigmarchaeota archaeon]|nr:sugar phosphate nucleotidyltransferase [Candidatus Aenigmarchaeota archaeon]
MKIVILAAGKGVRMNHLTLDRPKPMIEIDNHPFLAYLFEIIHNSGFVDKDIGIVVGYKKEKIVDFLKSKNLKCKIIEQKEQIGTAHAIGCAQRFVNKDNFLVIMADNIYSENDIMSIKKDDDFCYMAGYHHDDPRRFGIIVEKDGFVEKLVEKPDHPPSNMINTGLYKFTPEIFEAIKTIHKSPRGEYEITDAIMLLAKKKKVRVIHAKTWIDLGKPEDIEKVEEFLRKRK